MFGITDFYHFILSTWLQLLFYFIKPVHYITIYKTSTVTTNWSCKPDHFP